MTYMSEDGDLVVFTSDMGKQTEIITVSVCDPEKCEVGRIIRVNKSAAYWPACRLGPDAPETRRHTIELLETILIEMKLCQEE